jgi:hypothetical protein
MLHGVAPADFGAIFRQSVWVRIPKPAPKHSLLKVLDTREPTGIKAGRLKVARPALHIQDVVVCFS